MALGVVVFSQERLVLHMHAAESNHEYIHVDHVACSNVIG